MRDIKEYVPFGYCFEIFQQRYAFHKDETFREACWRVAGEIAKAEKPENFARYRQEFFNILVKNMFSCGGRIWRNAGRSKANMMNCFVVPSEDSREGWGQLISDFIVISGNEGGVGINFSPIRPRGSIISSNGGEASGPVSLMEIVDKAGAVIKGGGNRRAAAMFALRYDHPDIEEFLDKKLTLGELSNANISVIIDQKFIDAVVNNEEIELTFGSKTNKKIKARNLYDRLIDNAVKSGEPGILNLGLANEMNNYYYDQELTCTNPCITGDTLIATADGRNAVSIQQLADEGKDIPVYSTDVNTGQIQIKMGRNPRKTKVKAEIWKLTLDDGSTFRATPDHLIPVKGKGYTRLQDLNAGDSLFAFNSFEQNRYRQICRIGQKTSGGTYRNRRQYRTIHEFYSNTIAKKDQRIHHVDFNSHNDSYCNLQLMSDRDHTKLHADHMRGTNNPMVSKRDKIDWKQYHDRMSRSVSGLKNGRAYAVSNEELLEHGKKLFTEKGILNKQDWIQYATKNKLPKHLNKFRFGGWKGFVNAVSTNHKVVSVEFCGYEDVYNITVDDNHNYNIINSYADEKFIVSSGFCVKNCGELFLHPYGSCNLGSLVLTTFVDDKQNFDWQSLNETIGLSVRFLDNVLDLNVYPLDAIERETKKYRRIGLGIMGLHDMLIKLGMKYGSEESFEFVDKLMGFIKKKTYEASTYLAAEKGCFPAYDKEYFLKGNFVKGLTPGLKTKIAQHGIRNAALLTIAPTGTTGIVSATTGGIEPIFCLAYERSYRDKHDTISKKVVVHPLFEEFVKAGKDTSNFQSALDIAPEAHLRMQEICQKHVDGSISKTINLPRDFSDDNIKNLILMFLPNLKGITVYKDGARGESPLKPLSVENAVKSILDGISSTEAAERKCSSGVCTL